MSPGGPVPDGLVASDGALAEQFDLLLLDLDGVVYLGDHAIDGAADALQAARRAGARLVFVTNNAARPPAEVADQLSGMGVPATVDEVMTSAMAAAQRLAGDLAAGSAVLVVGGEGVRAALDAAGLRPVDRAEDEPVAVVQGFGPDVGWHSLAEASIALRAGARWVATNIDRTLPSPRGPLPGNGSLVAALATATGLTPEVIGKPEPALYEAALRAIDGRRPLGVGDRLDTDIEGARAAGLPSMVVLTGVSSAADLLAAAPERRPNFLGRDLRALGLDHPGVELRDRTATCRATTASIDGGTATLSTAGGSGGSGGSSESRGSNAVDADGLDGLRALCALAWSQPPGSAHPADPDEHRRQVAERYGAALRTLDLPE
jgi:HAD superfamily hydrolase (TIGR01450 family)